MAHERGVRVTEHHGLSEFPPDPRSSGRLAEDLSDWIEAHAAQVALRERAGRSSAVLRADRSRAVASPHRRPAYNHAAGSPSANRLTFASIASRAALTLSNTSRCACLPMKLSRCP